MLPATPPTALELLAGGKPVTTAAACNFFASYAAIPPGAATLTVRRAGDRNGAIKQVPVNLPAQAFVTILVSDKGGQPNVELINDTIDPKTPASGQLVLRQLFPNARVTASLGTPPAAAIAAAGASSTILGYGEAATLNSLPLNQSTLNLQATVQGQGVKTWSLQVDFAQHHHNTLLIIPDGYGHFRPHLAADGEGTPDEIAAVTDARH